MQFILFKQAVFFLKNMQPIELLWTLKKDQTQQTYSPVPPVHMPGSFLQKLQYKLSSKTLCTQEWNWIYILKKLNTQSPL